MLGLVQGEQPSQLRLAIVCKHASTRPHALDGEMVRDTYIGQMRNSINNAIDAADTCRDKEFCFVIEMCAFLDSVMQLCISMV